MKQLLHLPGLMLLALCGMACCLFAWERGEEWCAEQYTKLEGHCR